MPHDILVHDVLTFARRMCLAFGYELHQFELDPPKELGPFVEGSLRLFAETRQPHETGTGAHIIRIRWQQLLSNKWSATVAFGDESGNIRTSPDLENAIVTALRATFEARILAATA